MPDLLAKAEGEGARQELKELLQGIVEVIEWRQDAADPKKGDAVIELYPLPGFWVGDNQDGAGSLKRQEWLRQ